MTAHAQDADRIAWIDATAGIAGDMLLGALVEAGASLSGIQSVVEALMPGSVRLSARSVDRCGQRCTKADVQLLVEDPPHRTWASIRAMLTEAGDSEAIPRRTAELALAAFARLAEAEGATHGMDPDDVHFHEVGALDSIVDVVGVCEAWRQLGIGSAVGSVLAVGSGRIRAAHGDIPVPVPAVGRLTLGWPTVAGELLPARGHHGHSHDHDDGGHPHSRGQGLDHGHGHGQSPDGGHSHHHSPHPHDEHEHEHEHEHEAGGPHPAHAAMPGAAAGIGELATPTGAALLRTLAATHGAQPPMIVEALGVGAGGRDTPGRPNAVRVLIGRALDAAAEGQASSLGAGRSTAVGSSGRAVLPDASPEARDAHGTPRQAVQLEANVDDLDPRLWPGVIDALLEAGALDAWLTPIIMKRGRPAQTLHALVPVDQVDEQAQRILELTGSLGVRHAPVQRVIRTRSFDEIEIEGQRIAVKIARDDTGAVRRAEPEFRDVARAAEALGRSQREVLEQAKAAARDLLG